ncbi:PilN domain-containing protein [Candidatus Thiosymbion oneisti]|uniref:PilN domain-containing protein n=1 Tax=Candidatus Thiosymbion oneisti TaxID=589554 RepID=UPI000B7E3B5B|nr:PilN domain-containing protein [Candidatus Thiosymbion oneisti]
MAITDAFHSLRASVLERRSSLDGFLEHGRALLLSCLPNKLRRLLARREQRLIVVPMGTQAQVFESQDGEEVAVGELKLNPQAPGSSLAMLDAPRGESEMGLQTLGSLPAVLDATKGRRRRTLVRLPEGRVLRRRVMFPAQVRDNLVRVLEYEMDRLSPFRSEQVYFDFRTLEGPAPGGRVNIELAICLRGQVQDWLQHLHDRRAPVERISWEGAWPQANLLPVRERPRRSIWPLSMNTLLLLLVLLLGVAVLGTPIWQLQRTQDERMEQLADLKVRTEQVHAARTDLERGRQGSVAVLQRKRELPRIIDLMLELTDRLPDHTWVQNLDYQDGEIQIRGESEQATALINLLDQAPGITGVRFRSPVVQVKNSNWERFHISMQYGRPQDS